MHKNLKNIIKLSVGLIIASSLMLTGCSNSNKELAKIGNYSITQEIVSKEVAPYIAYQKEIYEDSISKDELKSYQEELEKSMLQYLSEIEALNLEATKNKYTVEQKEIDESYDYAVEQVKYYFDMDMETFAKEYGFSLEEIKENIKKQTIASSYLFDTVTVDDKAISDYYNKNKESFKMVQASHILISNKNEYLPEDAEYDENGKHTHADGTVHDVISESEQKELDKIKEDNIKRAKEVLEKAKKGEDFKSLSDQYSEDTAAKEAGGDLGFFKAQEMVTEFSEAAFNPELKNNEVYGEIVTTTYGYHIIKKVDEKYETLEEASSYIKNKLISVEVENFLAKLRKDYNIPSVSNNNSNTDDVNVNTDI